MRDVAWVMRTLTDPPVHLALCRVCTWTSHPGGTTHDGAVLAAQAHVEGAHGIAGAFPSPKRANDA